MADPNLNVSTLLEFYRQELEYCRHHENQRASAFALVFTITTACLGLALYDARLTTTDLPLAILVAASGAFAIAFACKHYERYRFHSERLMAIRDKISELLPEIAINEILEKARDRHFTKFRFRWTLQTIWVWSAALVIALGVLLGVLILLAND